MEMRAALELLGSFTAEQWGMVTSKQARTVGIDAVTLFRLKEAGFLETVRHGVYAATTAVVTAAREEQAAWLSIRPAVPGWERQPLHRDDAVLSHGTAARLHGLGELTNSEIAMTAPRRRTSRDTDLWFKIAQLEAEDVTLIDGLPVTTVLRTVCDLLDQHIDASHIATIIRQAVLADKIRLDELTERIAPYARRYRVRPNDGGALLEHLLEQIGVTAADLVTRPAPAQLQVTAASNALQHLALGSGTGKTYASGQLINELAKQSSLSPALTETLRQIQQQLGTSALSTHFSGLADQYRNLVATPALSRLVADLAPRFTLPEDVTRAILGSRLPPDIPQALASRLASGELMRAALDHSGRGEGADERDESAPGND